MMRLIFIKFHHLSSYCQQLPPNYEEKVTNSTNSLWDESDSNRRETAKVCDEVNLRLFISDT